MTDEERRAELIERKYQFLAEQEARAQEAAQPEPPVEVPIESRQARWEREGIEQAERQARARRELARRQAAMTETPPAVDWAAHIQASLANERAFLIEVVGTAIGELRAELEEKAQQRVDDAMRPLRVELAELKISNCELRITNSRLREQLTNNGSADSAGISSALN